MNYAELKRPDIEQIDKANKVVVLPLGSLEQHGQHLPLFTDSMIGADIAERVATALPETVLLMPMQWLGASDHHLKFPGTVSVPSELYVNMVCHMCECILSAGFRRIFLLLSHGGNDVPCREAIYRLGLKHRDRSDFWIASAGWWALADDVLRLPEMETLRPTHACEYETSLMLRLRDDLVDMNNAKGETLRIESKYYCNDGSAPNRVNISVPFEQMTSTGALGRPELGTASKGGKLMEVITARIVDFVREFANWPQDRRK